MNDQIFEVRTGAGYITSVQVLGDRLDCYEMGSRSWLVDVLLCTEDGSTVAALRSSGDGDTGGGLLEGQIFFLPRGPRNTM